MDVGRKSENGRTHPGTQQKRSILPCQQYQLQDQDQFPEAIEYLKKAEKSITEELKIEPKNQKINQIAGITFNNLACYYKKYALPYEGTKNPKSPWATSKKP